MPPSMSVPLAFLFYGMFLLIFGRLSPSVFAGLVFGYVCYDMLHYATHHFPMKRGVWLWLKQYHLRHHYKDDQVGLRHQLAAVGLRFPDDAKVIVAFVASTYMLLEPVSPELALKALS